MDRENAVTIKLIKYPNLALGILLSTTENDCSKEYQEDFDTTDIIFWFNKDKVPVELFKFSEYFDWLVNSANIWIRNDIITKDNYRTKVWDTVATETIEGVFHYIYADYTHMTNVRPISKDELETINNY